MSIAPPRPSGAAPGSVPRPSTAPPARPNIARVFTSSNPARIVTSAHSTGPPLPSFKSVVTSIPLDIVTKMDKALTLIPQHVFVIPDSLDEISSMEHESTLWGCMLTPGTPVYTHWHTMLWYSHKTEAGTVLSPELPFPFEETRHIAILTPFGRKIVECLRIRITASDWSGKTSWKHVIEDEAGLRFVDRIASSSGDLPTTKHYVFMTGTIAHQSFIFTYDKLLLRLQAT